MGFESKSTIMDSAQIRRAIKRISHEITERNRGLGGVVVVGIRRRGVYLAERIARYLESIEAIPLIKTHETPKDETAAVYIVRDGRAACASLWEFYGRKLPMEAVISGQHRFGTWAHHLSAWRPWERPKTLLVKYEETLSDLPIILEKISKFLNREIINHKIPERDTVASVDGRWVRKKSDWRKSMTDEQLELFHKTNKSMMIKMDYEPD